MNPTRHRAGIAARLALLALGLTVLASCTTETTEADGVVAVEAAGYSIVAGDTLSGIAQRAGVSVGEIVAANGWSDGSDHLLLPGDVIQLPQGAAVAPSSAPSPSAPSSSATSSVATESPASMPATAPPVVEAAACDSDLIGAAIDDFVSVDGFVCDQGWAGIGYFNTEGFYTPAILRAEGPTWVLQDWRTVCVGNAEVPGLLQGYCPGG
jgi:LysM repeat protein